MYLCTVYTNLNKLSMKKLFFIITFLVMSIIAKAQVMYFILSGHSPDENNLPISIVVKDNSGQLWMCSSTYIVTVKQNLLANRNYYVDAFNTGSHTIPSKYLPYYYGTEKAVNRCDENIIWSKQNYNLIFRRLIILQRTQKSIVCESAKMSDGEFSFKYAFSLDFKTMIDNPDRVNPLYHTSVPVDRFIERSSIDDLF